MHCGPLALLLFLNLTIGLRSFGSYLSMLFQDLTLKETHILLPLLAFTLLFGLSPQLILNSLSLFVLINPSNLSLPNPVLWLYQPMNTCGGSTMAPCLRPGAG